MEYKEYKTRFIRRMVEIIGEQAIDFNENLGNIAENLTNAAIEYIEGDLEVYAKASWEYWSDPEEGLQDKTPEQMAEAEIECWD